MRDLILYFALAGLPIVSFWLQQEAYPETPFYASMLVVFLLVLVWMKNYYKDELHARAKRLNGRHIRQRWAEPLQSVRT